MTSGSEDVVVIQENTVKGVLLQITTDPFHVDLHLRSSSFFNRGFRSDNHLGGDTLSQYRHAGKPRHLSSR